MPVEVIDNKNRFALRLPGQVMSGEIFTDDSMLEIFRTEVEAHVEALTSGLLALERNPDDTSNIDEMMRGAHSIKGAARIVGIDPAVRVAHVMEDGFVAAQNGKLTLRPAHVDALLRGVDMLNRIANATKNSEIDWPQFNSEATPLVAEITAVLAGALPLEPIASKSPDRSASHPSALVTSGTPPIPSLPTLHETTIVFPKILDAAAAETIRYELIAGIDARLQRIRFDLTNTVDLDATGLALLVAVAAHVSPNGPRVELSGASTDLRRVFQATGIDQLYASGGP